jgi:hypothetical protein
MWKKSGTLAADAGFMLNASTLACPMCEGRHDEAGKPLPGGVRWMIGLQEGSRIPQKSGSSANNSSG